MKEIYCQNFYDIITPPNKKELLEKLSNISKSRDQFFSWKTGCNVETERIEKSEVSNLISPSVHVFLRNFKFIKTIDVELVDVWKNVYGKGCFQEIHDHIDDCDFSSVLFMNEPSENFGKFYFYNRNITEISQSWRKLLFPYGYNKIIEPQKGDILFFPSHMLHGVIPHKSNKTRTTFTFNFKFM